MTEPITEHRAIDCLRDDAPEIGRALGALEDARRRTLEGLDGVDEGVLNWMPPGEGNSIGTLLYHIGAIEFDYLCADVLEQTDYPPDLMALFPHDVRDDRGHLTAVRGLGLATHKERLGAVRARLLATFRAMPPAEFRRARQLTAYGYDVTPEWVLHHLGQHEAEHRGEIALLRQLAEREIGGR